MQITPAMVKELREKTDAGMMECKHALVEAGGDMGKAVDVLRTKGMSSASKKASRTTKDGVIGSYIHFTKKLGVMVEVNCETDFVARNDKFQELVHDIAMQIAASNPRWVKREDVPADVVDKEREIYRGQMKDSGKPEKVIEKIVEGKLEKFYKDFCLLDQEFIKSAETNVQDHIAAIIGVIKENIQVKRFVRYALGEE